MLLLTWPNASLNPSFFALVISYTCISLAILPSDFTLTRGPSTPSPTPQELSLLLLSVPLFDSTLPLPRPHYIHVFLSLSVYTSPSNHLPPSSFLISLHPPSPTTTSCYSFRSRNTEREWKGVRRGETQAEPWTPWTIVYLVALNAQNSLQQPLVICSAWEIRYNSANVAVRHKKKIHKK